MMSNSTVEEILYENFTMLSGNCTIEEIPSVLYTNTTLGDILSENCTVGDVLNSLNSKSFKNKKWRRDLTKMNEFYLPMTIIYCILWPLITIVGIIGNGATMIVICRLKDSTTSSLFLMMLAISDTTTLCIKSIYIAYAWWEIYFRKEVLGWTSPTSPSFLFFKLSHVPERLSKVITVLITMERVLAVAMPMTYRRVCTRKRVVCAIIMTCIVTLGTSLPNNVDTMLYERNAKSQTYTEDGRLHIKIMVQESTYKMVHRTINRIIFDFAPIPVIAVCNVLIVTLLRRSKSITNDRRKGKEKHLTRLLLAISFCFLILCAPYDIYALFALTTSESVSNTFLMREIFKILTLLNSSINFIIYVVMSPKYREEYKKVIICHYKREDREEKLTVVQRSSIGANSI